MTGLKPTGAAVVLARRCGKPNVHWMSLSELEEAEQSFLERCHLYFDNLQNAIHASG